MIYVRCLRIYVEYTFTGKILLMDTLNQRNKEKFSISRQPTSRPPKTWKNFQRFFALPASRQPAVDDLENSTDSSTLYRPPGRQPAVQDLKFFSTLSNTIFVSSPVVQLPVLHSGKIRKISGETICAFERCFTNWYEVSWE